VSVIYVGMWLGHENRVIRLVRSRRYGWIATDSTGELYCERKPAQSTRLITPVPLGLFGSSVQYDDIASRRLHAWPQFAAGDVPPTPAATLPDCGSRTTTEVLAAGGAHRAGADATAPARNIEPSGDDPYEEDEQ